MAWSSPVFVFIYNLIILFPPLVNSVSFQITSFGPDVHQVLLEGDAEIFAGEIKLTNTEYVCRVGRLLYNGRVPIWEEGSGKLTDFSTHFSFRIDTQNRTNYGNGLAFFLAPVGFQIPPNSPGGFLGLFNTSTTDVPQSQIVSIEFDTYSNGWDPKYEHVGINKNSISSVVTIPWNASLHSGESANATITYNSTTHNLTVFWSYGNGPKSSLSYNMDLRQVLPPWVFVGITAATGYLVENHVLESWEFSSNLVVEEGGRSRAQKIGFAVGFSLLASGLIAGAAVVLIALRKRKKRGEEQKNSETAILTTSINDDLERGAGPRRFSYEELAMATHNFSDDKKLGQGGFGGVYKGYLISLDMPVAVKKFSRGSKQGKKEYITEIKIISMLRHRNLVQLIGWCHDQNEFLLVYEFMPNGSLDYHLFGKRNPLSWSFRYKIALGLASALLYLHEEWEQGVIHRDIKSSNVMLDSSFNVKLGDFGLARLMDHELGPQTTGLAGTLGYLAPEYVRTSRASKESDMYSFGVVMLEIATGRKVVERKSEQGLVEWVWELYGKAELLSAMDVKLTREFNAREVECLMIVGLWCAHPDHTLRPSIRVASRVLNFEAELPTLPMHMPVPMYSSTPCIPSINSADPLISDSSINLGR